MPLKSHTKYEKYFNEMNLTKVVKTFTSKLLQKMKKIPTNVYHGLEDSILLRYQIN